MRWLWQKSLKKEKKLVSLVELIVTNILIRPDITVDVNQTDGSAEIYFDTDRGSKGYAKD